MLRFLDLEKPRATTSADFLDGFDAASWASSLAPPADQVVLWGGPEVEGYAGARRRIGGVFTHPAATMLGLRGFDDAQEGLVELGGAPVPYAIFDVEKIVRMLLHQSGLAFEILVSPVVLRADETLPVKRLVEAAITGELVLYYRDIAAARIADWREDGQPPADLADLFRTLLSGAMLARDGVVSLHLPTLVAHHGAEALADIEAPHRDEAALLALAGELLELLEEGAPALPERPADYDWLNDWLVARRLATIAGD